MMTTAERIKAREETKLEKMEEQLCYQGCDEGFVGIECGQGVGIDRVSSQIVHFFWNGYVWDNERVQYRNKWTAQKGWEMIKAEIEALEEAFEK